MARYCALGRKEFIQEIRNVLAPLAESSPQEADAADTATIAAQFEAICGPHVGGEGADSGDAEGEDVAEQRILFPRAPRDASCDSRIDAGGATCDGKNARNGAGPVDSDTRSSKTDPPRGGVVVKGLGAEQGAEARDVRVRGDVETLWLRDVCATAALRDAAIGTKFAMCATIATLVSRRVRTADAHESKRDAARGREESRESNAGAAGGDGTASAADTDGGADPEGHGSDPEDFALVSAAVGALVSLACAAPDAGAGAAPGVAPAAPPAPRRPGDVFSNSRFRGSVAVAPPDGRVAEEGVTLCGAAAAAGLPADAPAHGRGLREKEVLWCLSAVLLALGSPVYADAVTRGAVQTAVEHLTLIASSGGAPAHRAEGSGGEGRGPLPTGAALLAHASCHVGGRVRSACRAALTRFLDSLGAPEAVEMLFSGMARLRRSHGAAALPAVRLLSSLLTRAVPRPDGVRAVCERMLGNVSRPGAEDDKIVSATADAVSRAVVTGPGAARGYFEAVGPQIVKLLTASGTQRHHVRRVGAAAVLLVSKRHPAEAAEFVLGPLAAALATPGASTADIAGCVEAMHTLMTARPHADPLYGTPAFLGWAAEAVFPRLFDLYVALISVRRPGDPGRDAGVDDEEPAIPKDFAAQRSPLAAASAECLSCILRWEDGPCGGRGAVPLLSDIAVPVPVPEDSGRVLDPHPTLSELGEWLPGRAPHRFVCSAADGTIALESGRFARDMRDVSRGLATLLAGDRALAAKIAPGFFLSALETYVDVATYADASGDRSALPRHELLSRAVADIASVLGSSCVRDVRSVCRFLRSVLNSGDREVASMGVAIATAVVTGRLASGSLERGGRDAAAIASLEPHLRELESSWPEDETSADPQVGIAARMLLLAIASLKDAPAAAEASAEVSAEVSAEGSMAEGSMAEGSMAEGSMAEGSMAEGSMAAAPTASARGAEDAGAGDGGGTRAAEFAWDEPEDSDDDDDGDVRGNNEGDRDTLRTGVDASADDGSQAAAAAAENNNNSGNSSNTTSGAKMPLARDGDRASDGKHRRDGGATRDSDVGVGHDADGAELDTILSELRSAYLPVRAHALIALQNYVRDHGARLTSARIETCLSVFREGLADEESYVYLHAIQGFVALADAAPALIVPRIAAIYASGDANDGFDAKRAGARGASDPSSAQQRLPGSRGRRYDDEGRYIPDTGAGSRGRAASSAADSAGPGPRESRRGRRGGRPVRSVGVGARIKLGDAIVRISERLGQLLPHYADDLVPAILEGYRDAAAYSTGADAAGGTDAKETQGASGPGKRDSPRDGAGQRGAGAGARGVESLSKVPDDVAPERTEAEEAASRDEHLAEVGASAEDLESHPEGVELRASSLACLGNVMSMLGHGGQPYVSRVLAAVTSALKSGTEHPRVVRAAAFAAAHTVSGLGLRSSNTLGPAILASLFSDVETARSRMRDPATRDHLGDALVAIERAARGWVETELAHEI